MTVRILVAEDEENIRLALKTIVNKNLLCDEVIACENGQDAWEKLQTQTYSLVISDWNMPLKTGFELLEAMRSNEQTRNIPMLLLTARSDKSSVITALQAGVSDYITKPFDKAMLIQKASKLLAKSMADTAQVKMMSSPESSPTTSVADEVVKRIKSGENALPVLPELAVKVEELFQRDEVELAELVKVVQTDPGITIKLINISNSPQYRSLSEIKSLDKAIARIGLKMTQNYVLVLAKRGLFKVDAPQYEALLNRIWQHSLATAACAQALAQKLALSEPDGYYTMGLLHDIGKLLLLQTFSEIAKKRPDANEQQCIDLMEQFHSEFGLLMLAKWKFPNDYQQVARYHEDVTKAPQPNNALYVVALANQLAIKNGFEATASRVVSDSDINQAAQNLRVGATIIEAVTQQMNEYMAAQAEM